MVGSGGWAATLMPCRRPPLPCQRLCWKGWPPGRPPSGRESGAHRRKRASWASPPAGRQVSSARAAAALPIPWPPRTSPPWTALPCWRAYACSWVRRRQLAARRRASLARRGFQAPSLSALTSPVRVASLPLLHNHAALRMHTDVLHRDRQPAASPLPRGPAPLPGLSPHPTPPLSGPTL